MNPEPPSESTPSAPPASPEPLVDPAVVAQMDETFVEIFRGGNNAIIERR